MVAVQVLSRSFLPKLATKRTKVHWLTQETLSLCNF